MEKSYISPFTMTPGIAGKALVSTHYSDEIIANFDAEDSYKYVYKIVGLRGSGKSVEYSQVIEHFKQKKNWLVYTLSAGGDPIQTLIAHLSQENFIDQKSYRNSVESTVTAGGTLPIFSADASIKKTTHSSDNDRYYSEEATLKNMLKTAKENHYRILIGIDDISKTDAMVRFLSVLGTILMESDMDVRFICTGLSKNIEDFVHIPHLSFFVRNESIVMKPLNLHDIALKYQELLSVSYPESVALSKFTLGYAYGYQVLGEICFTKGKSKIDQDVLDAFDAMIAPQYDLIWETLTPSEKNLLKIILNSDTGTVAEIKKEMASPTSFSSLRDRLSKKHMILSPARGELTVPLPRFKEYVTLWE